MRGDADIGMGDPGRGAKQDHALLSGERRRGLLCHGLLPRGQPLALLPLVRLSREVPPLHC